MSELQKELQKVKGIGKAKAQEIAEKYPDRFTFLAGLYANDMDNIKGISDDIVGRMKEQFPKEELEDLKKNTSDEDETNDKEQEESSEDTSEETNTEEPSESDKDNSEDDDTDDTKTDEEEASNKEPTYDEFIDAVVEFVQSDKGKELQYFVHLHQGRFLTIAYRSKANFAVNFRKNSKPYYHRTKTRKDFENNMDERYHDFLNPY